MKTMFFFDEQIPTRFDEIMIEEREDNEDEKREATDDVDEIHGPVQTFYFFV